MARRKSPLPARSELLLDEESLIRLAMREMRGRRPPVADESPSPEWGVPRVSRSQGQTLLGREMTARGWDVRDLCQSTGLSPTEAHALVQGNLRLSEFHAELFARAFATSSEFWMQG